MKLDAFDVLIILNQGIFHFQEFLFFQSPPPPQNLLPPPKFFVQLLIDFQQSNCNEIFCTLCDNFIIPMICLKKIHFLKNYCSLPH